MDGHFGFNKLYYWLESARAGAIVIGGSATPGLSLDELIGLSTDAEITRAALQLNSIKFNLGDRQGNLQLRSNIAAIYDPELSRLSTQDVIIANGTTGSNHIVHQALLKQGDHIICQYPIYGPCIEEPLHIGCEISYLGLDADNGWSMDVKQLESLIVPGKTKMLMLNNPVNPTGTHLSTAVQKEIVEICKKHDIIIHCDEIFRPLFHGDVEVPTSLIEHQVLGYDKIVVTSSLSKVYGMSGVRIGWIVCRSATLREIFKSYRVMSLTSVSVTDEAIATEALSHRVRPGILAKHHALAKTNIAIVQEFIEARKDVCDWVKPDAGSTCFIRFKDRRTGRAVDDVDFCRGLAEEKNVMLAPGSICFEFGKPEGVFKGRVRMSLTCPTERLQAGLELLGEFLASR